MSQNKVLPPTVLFGAIITELAFHYLLPLVKIFVFPYNILGLLPLVLGSVINVVADNQFKKAKTTVKPFQESTALITTGAFGISRNPMYLGFVLILLGLNILLGSVTPIIAVILYAIAIQRLYISVEESMLAEKFGSDWLNYKSRVRPWI